MRNYESIKILRTIVSFKYDGTVARNVDARDIRPIRSNIFGAFCFVSQPSYLTMIGNIFHGIFASSYFTSSSRVVSLLIDNLGDTCRRSVRISSHFYEITLEFVHLTNKERKVTIRLTSPLTHCLPAILLTIISQLDVQVKQYKWTLTNFMYHSTFISFFYSKQCNNQLRVTVHNSFCKYI